MGTLSTRYQRAKEASTRVWGSPRVSALKMVWPTAPFLCLEAGFLFAFLAHAELRSIPRGTT